MTQMCVCVCIYNAYRSDNRCVLSQCYRKVDALISVLVTRSGPPPPLPSGVSHLLIRRSPDGKWKVLRCAHALPGINVKAQKWRYTVPSCTPVSDISLTFFFQVTALRLIESKFRELVRAVRRLPGHSLRSHAGASRHAEGTINS